MDGQARKEKNDILLYKKTQEQRRIDNTVLNFLFIEQKRPTTILL